MMSHPYIFISPNGLISQIICKDWTQMKCKILIQNLLKLLSICIPRETLEANLKGLLLGLKKSHQRKNKIIALCILNILPGKKMELWAVHKYYTYLQKSNQKKKA
jgi:hypothetical protein